jgi:TRAP transporter 4TM/12TM fusion protein
MSNTFNTAAADANPGFHDPTSAGFTQSFEGRLLFWIAVVFSAFQIATAAHLFDLPSQVQRACHVGFLLLLTFPLIAINRNGAIKIIAWILALSALGVAGYQWVEYEDLLIRAGDPTELDIYLGVVAIATVFVGTWVLMGPALPIICGTFFAYCLFGQYLPAPFDHRGYDFHQVIEHMAYGTEGIYGIPTYVSASYIFLFILFGAFLEKAGMIKLFTDFALGLVGHAQGGAAKVAVVSSALMGTISGSGVANVVTTGQFTIPLMKRFGYRAAFAGGVESTASMGGQLMPPVMGAVAFIMAETLGVAYSEIVKAAIIPAILYFFGAFWMVHLEAGKHGLKGLDKKDLPSPLKAVKEQWYLVIPLVALVWLLVGGYTPLFAGTVGLAFTVVLILGASIAIGLPNTVIRVLFWIGLGVVCAAFLQFGIWVIAGAIIALIALNAMKKGGRETLAACRDSLADGAKSALPVGVALCNGGYHHWHNDADRCRQHLRPVCSERGREQSVPVAGADHADLYRIGHGHSDHSQLHHHFQHRGPCIGATGCAIDCQPHVRVLFRHSGRPDPACGVGLFCRSPNCQGTRINHFHGGGKNCRGWFCNSLHGRVHPFPDASRRRTTGQ